MYTTREWLYMISTFYVGYFKRAMDKYAGDYWLAQYPSRTETDANDMAGQFYGAALAFGFYPPSMTDAQFIAKVYENVLNRTSVPTADINWWVNQLNAVYGGDRGLVFRAMLNGFLTNDPAMPGTINPVQVRKDLTKFENMVQVGTVLHANNWQPFPPIPANEIANHNAGVARLAGFTGSSAHDQSKVISALSGGGYSVTSGNTRKILVIGQSNAGDYSDDEVDPNAYVTFYDRVGGYERAYRDKGAPGSAYGVTTGYGGGSIWSRLGELLCAKPGIKKVKFDVRAFPGASIQDLITGTNWTNIQSAVASDTFDTVIFQQGESDKGLGTTQADYTSRLNTLVTHINSVLPSAKIYIARTSYWGGTSAAVRAAQNAVIASKAYCYAGPDTDAWGSTYRRSDNLHFNGAGQNGIAAQYSALI